MTARCLQHGARGRFGGHRGVETFGNQRQHSGRSVMIALIQPGEHIGEGVFDRAVRNPIDPRSGRRQAKQNPSPIARVNCSDEQSLPHQALQHTGERAGMHVNHGCQLAWGYPPSQPHHSQHQALWACDADVFCHPFRALVQGVHYGPQQLHKLQHGWKDRRRVARKRRSVHVADAITVIL